MVAGSGLRRCGTHRAGTECWWHSEKANQFSWLTVARELLSAVEVFSFLVLISCTALAQTPNPHRNVLVHGSIITAQGQPVARATVELRDQHGIKIATGFTDSSGSFALATAGKPGVYVVVAEKEWQMGDEWVTLDQSDGSQSDRDHTVTIALPATAVDSPGTSQRMYTVSAQELRVPAKAREHLILAQREFGKSNFAAAEKEIDQALKADSIYAPAFCMRALVRLAARNPIGAIDDATHALALNPAEADAYVALATAYNSLSKFEKAETAARVALGMRPDSWQGRLELAKSFYGEGQFVLALRELDEMNKDFPDVHLVRADILQCLQRSQEAAEEFGQFLRQAPSDPRSGQIRRIVDSAGAPPSPASSQQ